MTSAQRATALVKLAFYPGVFSGSFGHPGTNPIAGSTTFFAPQITVGQAMTDIGALQTLSMADRRRALDQIVSTGIDVNSPAKKLLSAGIGALAGKMVTKALGFGPFAQGVASTIGANYGYKF